MNDALLQAVEAARPADLDALSRALWSDHAAGRLNDDEAQALAETIQARRGRGDHITSPGGPRTAAVALGRFKSIYPARRLQQAPERSVLIERRRSCAASGWMPPAIACRFTLGEQAVLAVVAREIIKHSACELCVDALAALAGVSRRLVQSAIRLAHDTGLLHVEERRRHGNRNLPNRVTMLSREWLTWTKRRSGGGCKPRHPMRSIGSKQGSVVAVQTVRVAMRGEETRPGVIHNVRDIASRFRERPPARGQHKV